MSKSVDVKVGRVDRIFAGVLPRYLVGPLERIADVDEIKRRLVGAAADPRSRVGLHPDRVSRRWHYDPTCANISVTRGRGPLPRDPARALDEFAKRRTTKVPMRIETVDDYLLIEFDHGLGDVHFFTEILALVSGTSPGFVPPHPVSNCDHPASVSAFKALLASPIEVIKSAVFRPNLQVPAEFEGEVTGSAATVYGRTPPGFIDSVRQARDIRLPGLSLIPLIICALVRSMEANGIETDREIDLLMDLRRFLPSGKNTLANFTTVATIPINPVAGVASFAAALNEHTGSYRPLVRQLAATMVWTVRPVPAVMPSWRTSNAPARLVFTDITARKEMAKVSWIRDRPRTLVMSNRARQTHQITCGVARIGPEAHISLTYYPSNFDGGVLQKALDALPEFMTELMA